ncbi:MAG: lysophospholipase [Pedobacter sp.]|nr:MAG: lysophospholipase [Pedobacter sp.]
MTKHTSRRSFLRSSALTIAAGTIPIGIVRAGNSAKPNAQVKGLTVLFQGDSITDGNRGRNTDPNHIMGHGYAFSIASRWGADFPSADLVFYNRGISGNKVSQLQARWKTDCLDLHPDVLSVLVGINDAALFVEKPPEESEDAYAQAYEDTYRSILKQVREQNPHTLLVLGLPFMMPVGKFKENWAAYYSIVSKLSNRIRKLTAEFNAVLVDYQMVFDKAARTVPSTYWVWDGIHPTYSGHQLMADEWVKTVSEFQF